jgi:GNAT superfamily N-acetyltransferase
MHPRADEPLAEPLCCVVEIVVRACEQSDLAALEWFGQFTSHRAFVAAQFGRHVRGDNVMLVAAHRDYPVGQIWIELANVPHAAVASLWALRVLQPYQGLGIGRHLVAAAEAVARRVGRTVAEIGVEKHERLVRALYERLGYAVVREHVDDETYVAPDGRAYAHRYDQWILAKPL